MIVQSILYVSSGIITVLRQSISILIVSENPAATDVEPPVVPVTFGSVPKKEQEEEPESVSVPSTTLGAEIEMVEAKGQLSETDAPSAGSLLRVDKLISTKPPLASTTCIVQSLVIVPLKETLSSAAKAAIENINDNKTKINLFIKKPPLYLELFPCKNLCI